MPASTIHSLLFALVAGGVLHGSAHSAELAPSDTRELKQNLKALSHARMEPPARCGAIDSSTGITLKNPNRRWDKSEVRVCWVNGSGSRFDTCSDGRITTQARPLTPREARYHEIIRATVTREYQIARTGITFTGWTPCPAGRDAREVADVAIEIQDGFITNGMFDGMASMGRCLENPAAIGYLRIFPPHEGSPRIALSEEDSLRAIALHEFGHVAGLHHEDEQSRWRRTRQERERGTVVSEYDRGSIMSYSYLYDLLKTRGLTFTQKRGSGRVPHDPPTVTITPLEGTDQERVQIQIGLSSGDVHALKCLYQYSDQERQSKCHERHKLKP